MLRICSEYCDGRHEWSHVVLSTAVALRTAVAGPGGQSLHTPGLREINNNNNNKRQDMWIRSVSQQEFATGTGDQREDLTISELDLIARPDR